MAENKTIPKVIDKLLKEDLTKLSTDEIISIITGGKNLETPYVDPQSEKGFEQESGTVKKNVESLVESLKPKKPPIPLSRIEELSCSYQGDDLYARVLLESIKSKDSKLYDEIIKSDSIVKTNLALKDLGITNDGLSSEGIAKYLRGKDPKLFRDINESLFDNVSPTVLGKPSNSGSRKKRELNILGFKLSLEFIMAGSKIVHVKIGGPEKSNEQALSDINDILQKQNKGSKECDFDNLGDTGTIDTGTQNPKDGISTTAQDLKDGFSSKRLDAYDANFYPDGEDPIVDQDCNPPVPEDPITGDPVFTKELFDSIENDFCDPLPTDQTRKIFNDPEAPEPEPTSVDAEAIKACINSAFEKANKIDEDSKSLARWSMVERSLEEIYYHYEIIWEYQKSLADTWIARSSTGTEDTPNTLGLVIRVLTNTEIERLNKIQIEEKQKIVDADKKIFLDNNNVFTEEIFTLTVDDLVLFKTLTDAKLEENFKKRSEDNKSLVSQNQETKEYLVKSGVESFRKVYNDLLLLITEVQSFETLVTDTEEIVKQKEADLETLSQRKGKPVTVDNLELIFPQGDLDLFQKTKNKAVFQAVITPLYPYDGYGYKFLQDIVKFSPRFKKVELDENLGELKFELDLMTDYGNPVPYRTVKKPGKISLEKPSDSALVNVNEPDIEKIKIGNEYALNGGILNQFTPYYLKSNNFLTIKNLKTGEKDVVDFYSYVAKVLNTSQSKQSIINDMVDKNGILYGQLIEKSSSNWLFFTAEERGDNDARDPSKLRPSSFTADGDPNPVFVDFNSNFKKKWDAKYLANKQQYIIPAIDSLKTEARKAGEGLGNTINVSEEIGIRIFDNYFSLKKKIESIEELIVYAASKRSESEDSLTSQNIEKLFSGIKCAGTGGAGDNGQTGGDKVNCPPTCCGEAGSDFKSDNYLLSLPPSSDCPTIFQKCWWEQFCKDVTKVGMLPYPNGLPPIEKPEYFLAPGPTVRFGLKYWPVGYLPPAFIPIPVPNPVDGMPYIRIPLPMIWTVIKPILIPLPLNLGIIAIFIPFIGGFMPTPLVYIKEFITGSSLFLTGTRGPRFIPRKSDPGLNDPLENIKQALSFGIPDNLIPLPGFGQDDIDKPERILADIQTNLTKIFDAVPPPGNLEGLRDVQAKEIELKASLDRKRKDYLKKEALSDVPRPNFDSERQELDALVATRKSSMKNVIMDYIDKGIPEPKTIYFPQDKDKLKVDIPGIVKSLRSLKSMKSSLVPVKSAGVVNFKSEIKENLKKMKIVTPLAYEAENNGVSNSNKIFLRVNKDPRLMNEEEFKSLVSEIRGNTLKMTKTILKGNNVSVNKGLKKGAFSIVDNSELQGVFKFPPIQITNSAPKILDFKRVPDPKLNSMYDRIMSGMSSVPYTTNDFASYVRYNGEDPELVIRVKDLKKIYSKKIGLSRKSEFDNFDRPLDLEEPLISNYPYPEGPLGSVTKISDGFGKAISAFELPVVFPPKQDQVAQVTGLGGIIQVPIPGNVIKKFIKESVGKLLEQGVLEEIMPEINVVNSPKFINMNPNDIQKISRKLVQRVLDPNSVNIPPFLDIAKIPVIPKARPTDMVEQVLIGMGVPPPARIVYSLFWKYFKGVPKTPLGESVTLPTIKAASEVLSKIPWPLTVLLGRNALNLINPIALSDDHPVWRRMSLKNPYYVVYIDEFLRSAADVSGLFKFTFGAADPVYPIPELPTELQKPFKVKKY